MGQYNFIFIHNEKKKVPAISSLLSYLLKLTLMMDLNILENVTMCAAICCLILNFFRILASLSFEFLIIVYKILPKKERKTISAIILANPLN